MVNALIILYIIPIGTLFGFIGYALYRSYKLQTKKTCHERLEEMIKLGFFKDCE